jgi:hypothetical protein
MMIWAFNSGNFLAYGFSYLELEPKYKCDFSSGTFNSNGLVDPSNSTDEDLNSYIDCVPSDFCGSDMNYYIDWSDPESLHNWVETLDLACMNSEINNKCFYR